MIAQLPIVELQYLDSTGSRAVVLLHAPAGTTYDEAEASAIALASLMSPLTNCVLVRVRVLFKYVAIPHDVADVGSFNKRMGVFVFENTSGESNALVAVPGILDSVLETTGDGAGILIDLAIPAVADFVDAYIGSIWCNPFAVDMQALVIAYRQSRL